MLSAEGAGRLVQDASLIADLIDHYVESRMSEAPAYHDHDVESPTATAILEAWEARGGTPVNVMWSQRGVVAGAGQARRAKERRGLAILAHACILALQQEDFMDALLRDFEGMEDLVTRALRAPGCPFD